MFFVACWPSKFSSDFPFLFISIFSSSSLTPSQIFQLPPCPGPFSLSSLSQLTCFVLHLCSDDSERRLCPLWCRTSEPVLFRHVHSFLSLCVRCLTLVFCCDVVELGTYGKLKYYHSMTEEGKPESFHVIPSVIFCNHFLCCPPSWSQDDTCNLMVLFRWLFRCTSSLSFHWHKCKSWQPPHSFICIFSLILLTEHTYCVVWSVFMYLNIDTICFCVYSGSKRISLWSGCPIFFFFLGLLPICALRNTSSMPMSSFAGSACTSRRASLNWTNWSDSSSGWLRNRQSWQGKWAAV